MKSVLITMVFFHVFVLWQGYPLANLLFPWAESNLKPIYLGIVFLSGLIVGCTVYLAEQIRELKSEPKEEKAETAAK